MKHPSYQLEKFLWMLVAASAATMLFFVPVFAFDSDMGINYTKTYRADFYHIDLIYTDVHTGVSFIEQTRYLWFLCLCHSVMLVAPVVAMFRYHRKQVLRCCYIGGGAAIGYVLGVLWYCVSLSGDWCATVRPSWAVIFPFVSVVVLLNIRTILYHRR